MSLDPRRVLIFRDVVRAGSISAAARELGWTQPAVSQHLARLERETGGTLLIRGSQGVTPTQAGQALLRRADSVAGELHAASEELAAFSELRAGRVRLVAFPSAAATLVPDAVANLAVAHPGLEVSLVEAEPPEAVTAVWSGDADLALVFAHGDQPAGAEQLAWRPLSSEPVHLVVPVDHPAARTTQVRLSSLAAETWVGGCDRCREHLESVCRAAGFVPEVRHLTDDYVVVQNLVARGLGVTLLPDSALRAYRHPDVVIRRSATLGRRRLGVVHRRGAEQVPATATLIDELTRAARTISEVAPEQR